MKWLEFFIPIILEYINKVSPDELDETTIEEVLKHFEVFLDKQKYLCTKKEA